MATNPSQSKSAELYRFCKAIQSLGHRGPDGQGEYRDKNVWLAHTRLSILDLSNAGSQPMRSADGRFAISYNGEVYNFRELAAEYELGDLRSSSDTEVVLRLFEKYGVESLVKLNGMFAFSIYDRKTQRLWLVRDRLGIKPLYYRINPASLAFASEIKGITALTSEAPTCNLLALHEWLYYGNTLGDRTLYDGISQLLPGHYLEIDLNSFEYEIHVYWSLKQQAGKVSKDNGRDSIDQTRRLLEQAVQRQLVSDVPVGVFLSGGIDSSAIAAYASRYYEGRLATYSVGFDFSGEGGELPKAKRVAALYETEHHELHIGGGDVGDLVERMVVHHDMPFSDAANIPLYLMATQISDQTKVVLQGDGGDELFGGYRRYATLKYHRLLHPLAQIFQNAIGVMPESPLRHRALRYLHAFAARDLATTMALLLTPEDRYSCPSDIFSPPVARLLSQSDPFARFHELYPLFHSHDIGNRMSLIDMSIVLPDIYLEKVDRSTMAASLEVRVPFLDHDLVDYVVRLSGNRKMPFGKKKWLLKAALKGVVPDDILYGPKKGFSVPYGHWLQTALKPLFFDHLTKFARTQPDVLNVERIKSLYARTNAGQQDHSFLLWKILNLLVWANHSNINFSEQGIN